MRQSRLLRWLTVVAVLVLGLAVVADVVSAEVAESRAANGFAQATAAERASVELGGFPFLPKLLRGRFDAVALEAVGLAGGGLRVARVNARVEDVSFSAGDALSLIRTPYADRTAIRTGRVIGDAQILEEDLRAFLRAKMSEVRDLRIVPSGVQVWLDVEATDDRGSPAVIGPVRFLPRIEDGRLVLRLVGEADLSRELRERVRSGIEEAIDLPPVPAGLAVGAELGDGSMALDASTVGLRLLVGEGGIRTTRAAGPRGRRPPGA